MFIFTFFRVIVPYEVFLTQTNWTWNIFSKRSSWPIYRTITETTILGQRGPESNGNEVVLYTSQNWSLTFRWNVVSYQRHHFLAGRVGGGLTAWQGIQSAHTKPQQQSNFMQMREPDIEVEGGIHPTSQVRFDMKSFGGGGHVQIKSHASYP